MVLFIVAGEIMFMCCFVATERESYFGKSRLRTRRYLLV